MCAFKRHNRTGFILPDLVVEFDNTLLPHLEVTDTIATLKFYVNLKLIYLF